MDFAPYRMPALFLAHGNPMNALEKNPFTESLKALAAELPRPEAVLIVSAHWETNGTRVPGSAPLKTIHDFYGFPKKLFELQYPAPAASSLSTKLEKEFGIATSEDWGLDHGAWSVLVHLFPEADVPVLQLSLDKTKTPEQHFDLGRKLAALRDQGILLIGSGNIVHNLRAFEHAVNAPAYPWAERFDLFTRDALLQKDFQALCDYEERAGCAAELSAPTPEHFLPLLYIAGAAREDDPVSFPYEGFQNASLSMRCVRFG